jgi:uncharacterized membrane protein
MTQVSRLYSTPRLSHPRLVSPAAALLVAAFVTDLVYWRSLSSQWETFSVWLLTGGLILAGLSGLALLVDIMLKRVQAIDWPRFAALTAAALLALLNAFVHSRDAYTAVVPQGLELSAIVTVILVVVGWRGWSLAAARPSPSAPSQGFRS